MENQVICESEGLKLKALFLPTASMNDPASRYRVYQYLDYLRRTGMVADYRAGISDFMYTMFAPYKGLFHKAIFFGLRALNRILAVFIIWRYDVIIIQRLVLPHVYPFPEILICMVGKMIGKRIIFDFDDAIFTTYAHRDKTPAERFSDANRLARVLARCDTVIAGNAYLASYAGAYNANVVIIPTTIDMNRYPAKKYEDKNAGAPYIIGWIGTPSSLPYLNILKPVFQELAQKHNILIRIIGGLSYQCPGVHVEQLPWSLQDEVSHILTFDIGVMPLPGDEYDQGKCGLKLLQYMAAGIPAVASPVGVNKDIIKDWLNGCLACSIEEWVVKISSLLQSTQLRMELGRRGRETVERKYSIQAVLPDFLEVLRG
ncbi:Glycosyl transferases group 1 [Pelotomaculum schinkii]|uniref:Glycosyl transferases group 1 n=1 Tax=Pelotomaculum schinkii TaxID=78350 RepID=A0A4Y7RC45_9FIRM|nr:Glycosyl transferases group 1 [Pelotomaculum schinkii]